MQNEVSKRLAGVRVNPGGREIVRLRYVGQWESWSEYEVIFVNTTADDWNHVVKDLDRRDVPYVFELEDGTTIPFARVFFGYDSAELRISVKYLDLDSNSHPSTSIHSGIFRFFRVFLWRRKIDRLLRSRDRDSKIQAIEMVTSECEFDDIPWVVTLLVESANSADYLLRSIAIRRLGELARRFGTTTEAAIRIVKAAIDDPDASVRRAGRSAQAELQKFVAPEMLNQLAAQPLTDGSI